MKAKLSYLSSSLVFIIAAAILMGCGKKSDDATAAAATSADQSASGAAASAAGGALSSSSSAGTQALYKIQTSPSSSASKIWTVVGQALKPEKAFAANLCPTFLTTSSGCSASGSDMWLSYSECTFAGAATWSGVQQISKSSGSATCGSFPNPGANGTLYRQYVQSTGVSTPGSVTLTADNWNVVIDDASANLGNFDSQTISTIHNGGYGAAISFNGSGARSSVTFGHRTYATGTFDHSVAGTLSVNETSGASSRQLNGTVTVYHNRLRVVGTSTFSNVTHQDMCCLPTSGTITTVFRAGSNVNPTLIGSAVVGKSESLTFTGCGTATYTDTDGSVSNVTLHRCF